MSVKDRPDVDLFALRELPRQAILVFNTLTDEARRLGGIRVKMSATDISQKTGIIRRRVYASLRILRERNYIDVESHKDAYGHAPNIYTLLPVGAGRLEKLEEFATMLEIPRAQAAEHVHRLWKIRDDAGRLDVDGFAERAGWTGDPARFVSAMILAGLVKDGKLSW